MRKDLDIETVKERRLSLRQIVLYKVVEGRVLSLPSDQFIQQARPKRTIKTKVFKDCVADNIIERHTINNTRDLKIPDTNKPQYKHSFFVDTICHWNHLPDLIMRATSVEAFKSALREHRP